MFRHVFAAFWLMAILQTSYTRSSQNQIPVGTPCIVSQSETCGPFQFCASNSVNDQGKCQCIEGDVSEDGNCFMEEETDTTTQEPDTTTTQEPDTTTTQEPDTTTTQEPDTTTTQNPESTTTPNPESTTTQDPESTTTQDPESTTAGVDGVMSISVSLLVIQLLVSFVV